MVEVAVVADPTVGSIALDSRLRYGFRIVRWHLDEHAFDRLALSALCLLLVVLW